MPSNLPPGVTEKDIDELFVASFIEEWQECIDDNKHGKKVEIIDGVEVCMNCGFDMEPQETQR